MSTDRKKARTPTELLDTTSKFLDTARAPPASMQLAERQRQTRNIWRAVHRKRRLEERAKLEEHMKSFVQAASARNFDTRDAFINQLIGQWYLALETHCGNYERAKDESECDDGCADDFCTIELYVDDAVGTDLNGVYTYGCMRHAAVHVCDKQTCGVTRVTRTRDRLCIFSGVKVGTQFSGIASINAAFKDGGDAGSAAMRASEYEASEVGTVSVRIGEAAAIVERIKREEFDQARGIKARPAKTTSRQTYTRNQKFSRAQRKSTEALYAIARQVIDRVLFDQEARDLINTIRMREAETAAHQNVLAYHTACRSSSRVPNLCAEMQAFATPMATFTMLPPVAGDTERRRRFVQLAVRLWELCHRSPRMMALRERIRRPGAQTKHGMRQSTCDYAQFCTALLFMHKSGFRVQRSPGSFAAMTTAPLVFVPRDPRMLLELPSEVWIDLFGDSSLDAIRGQLDRSAESVMARAGKESHIIKTNGQLRRRKARRKQRVTMLGSGSSSSTADKLPPHLHEGLLHPPEDYEQPDITRATKFIKLALESLPADSVEEEARQLFRF